MTFGNPHKFPFHSCNDNELKQLDINYSTTKVQPIVGPINETPLHCSLQVSQDDNDDTDGFLPANFPNCNSYSVVEFQNIALTNSFNIFHANVNGLENKIDDIHEFLANSKTMMDVIAFTETSLQSSNEFFSNNVTIENYVEFCTPELSKNPRK